MQKEHEPLYNSRITKSYLDYLERYYPDLDTEAVLNYAGMTRYEVEDAAHWFTQHQTDRFQEILVLKTGNTNISREVGRFVTSSEGTRTIRQYLLGLMNLESVFLLMGKLSHLMSRGSEVTAKRHDARNVEIVSTPKPGVQEKPYQCENRRGTFESLARLFTDRLAVVEHPQCFHRGDPCCQYLITWEKTASYTAKRVRNYASLFSVVLAITLAVMLPPLPLLAALGLLGAGNAALFYLTERLSKKELAMVLEAQSKLANQQLDESHLRYNHARLTQQIGLATSSILDIDDLVTTLAAVLHKHLQFDRSLIMLADPEHKELVYSAGYGYRPEHQKRIQEIRFNLDAPHAQGMFVKAFHKQEPYLAKDMEMIKNTFSERSRKWAEEMGVSAMACVPIVFENTSLGILAVDNVDSETPFTESDINLLLGVASQIAISINNAMSFQRLQESREKYRQTLESIEEGYFEVDLEGNFTFVNAALCRITGYRRDELLRMNNRDYTSADTAQQMYTVFNRVFRTRKPARLVEFGVFRKDGRPITVELSASLIHNSTVEPEGFRGVIRDVTVRLQAEEERQKLEAQLQQAQKMEAIGNLAGGIAHNFNNLLMGIQGNISLIRLQIDQAHPGSDRIENIQSIVESASQLTRQILGYARGGKYEVKPINLNRIVADTANTFGITRKEITVTYNLAEELFAIEADQNQIEQVLWNLFVNAADAMPNGGDLILTTQIMDHTQLQSLPFEVQPLTYVNLCVTDTGSGIAPENLESIFEPFFTTKALGKGTGLGLASVYGIIKAHGGYIDVTSQLQQGTTFNLYLPATAERVREAPPPSDDIARGHETVLLVDDEQMILDVGEKMLKHLGYTVLLADNGNEALQIYEHFPEAIDLAIIDMIMPGMGGEEIFIQIRNLNPSSKILLSSGYSLDGQAKRIMDQGCDGFIQKPFKLTALSHKVREILDGP